LIAELEQAERRATAETEEFNNLVAGVLVIAGFERNPGTEREWLAPTDWPERAARLREDIGYH
jgi:hypothetical protein